MLQPILRLSLAAFACLAAPLAHAQTVIAGQVVHHRSHAPLPNVALELLGVFDKVVATAQSGSDGTFALIAPEAGTYRVRLTAPGASPQMSDTVSVDKGEYAAREFAFDPEPRPLFEFQVDKPVAPARGSSRVKYPDELRTRGVSGCVLVQFVVDTTGRADTTTFRVLKMSHLEFAQAVRNALPGLRFAPAQLNGRKVSQIVHLPFDFSISSEPRAIYQTSVGAAGVVPTLPPTPSMIPPTPPLPEKPAICGLSSR